MTDDRKVGIASTAARPVRYLYGIGEWFGRSFVRLSAEERLGMAQSQLLPKRQRPEMPCIPRGGTVPCTKEGGVCSIRVYQQNADGQVSAAASGRLGSLVTTCPCRFEEDAMIFEWIGSTIIGGRKPLVVGEVGFLERVGDEQIAESTREDVGRIDNVLVRPGRGPLLWCAMEIQAVYFSGAAMSNEFRAIAAHKDPGIPFPVGRRRPDFRSCGPKRLMPQLQVKVPTLRRWGKKMAVVVDDAFFSALGEMGSVDHLSNADIAWFVVHYDESDGEARLRRGAVCLTTLEHAVEGLTAGRPVSLEVFESRIQSKLNGLAAKSPSTSGLCR